MARRIITEYSGKIGSTEQAEMESSFWSNLPFSARWEALREMLAFYYQRDLSSPNPFPVDRTIESFGRLSERWDDK